MRGLCAIYVLVLCAMMQRGQNNEQRVFRQRQELETWRSQRDTRHQEEALHNTRSGPRENRLDTLTQRSDELITPRLWYAYV